MISITQEWGVKVNYGGWHSDSDSVDVALCVMNHDDEGFFLTNGEIDPAKIDAFAATIDDSW